MDLCQLQFVFEQLRRIFELCIYVCFFFFREVLFGKQVFREDIKHLEIQRRVKTVESADTWRRKTHSSCQRAERAEQ